MSKERAPYRVSHCRFHNTRPLYKGKSLQTEINRIVTVAWNLDEKGILTYGATIYTKTGDSWDKKIHREKAIERFNTAPLRFNVCFPEPLNRCAIDWYISRYLVVKYGCYYKGKKIRSSRIDEDLIIDQVHFNYKYDPVGFENKINNNLEFVREWELKKERKKRRKECLNFSLVFSVSCLTLLAVNFYNSM